MLPISSLRTGREQHVAESSIYSLHLNTLFNSRHVTHHTYRPSSLTSQPLWLKLTSFTTFSIVNTNSFAVFGSAFAPSTSFTVLSWFARDQQPGAKCAFIPHTRSLCSCPLLVPLSSAVAFASALAFAFAFAAALAFAFVYVVNFHRV